MIELAAGQVAGWVNGFYWPFLRIGAMLTAAPVISARMVPVRFRLLLALALTAALLPVLPAAPALDPLSATGIAVTFQQVAIGVVTGFILQLVFAALVVGGQVIAMSMGLGFASMADPQNGVQVPVVSQAWLILGTLLFLALNGHLVLIELTVESFTRLPVAPVGLDREVLYTVADWAGIMFVGGLLLALPAVTAIMLTNLSFGVITRAAPQLNIFAVGFPVTMLIGFVVMLVSVGHVLPRFGDLMAEAFRLIAGLGAGQP